MSRKSEVFNEDCMIGMRRYPDKYFDLAVVDPPYGIGESGGKNKTRSLLTKSKDYKPFFGKDLEPPGKEYFSELARVSKNQIIFGANHFADRLVNPSSSCWLVWDKENGKTDFADCELAYTSFNTAVRIFRFRWQGMLQGNMKQKEVRIHPTQKPVALYAWIFQNYAKPGQKILDTHMGSQSSRIAAFEANLEFTGFEIDKTYFDLGNERFETHISQMSFFHMDEIEERRSRWREQTSL